MDQIERVNKLFCVENRSEIHDAVWGWCLAYVGRWAQAWLEGAHGSVVVVHDPPKGTFLCCATQHREVFTDLEALFGGVTLSWNSRYIFVTNECRDRRPRTSLTDDSIIGVRKRIDRDFQLTKYCQKLESSMALLLSMIILVISCSELLSYDILLAFKWNTWKKTIPTQ